MANLSDELAKVVDEILGPDPAPAEGGSNEDIRWAAALFGELGLSGNERGELRTCVNAYIQALERAPKFPELDKKMVKLDEQIRAADTRLHGEKLTDDEHDEAERELQGLLYEQASLRERWTVAKLAFESLPALRVALGLDADQPAAGK